MERSWPAWVNFVWWHMPSIKSGIFTVSWAQEFVVPVNLTSVFLFPDIGCVVIEIKGNFPQQWFNERAGKPCQHTAMEASTSEVNVNLGKKCSMYEMNSAVRDITHFLGFRDDYYFFYYQPDEKAENWDGVLENAWTSSVSSNSCIDIWDLI